MRIVRKAVDRVKKGSCCMAWTWIMSFLQHQIMLSKGEEWSWIETDVVRGKNASECYDRLSEVCCENALSYRTKGLSQYRLSYQTAWHKLKKCLNMRTFSGQNLTYVLKTCSSSSKTFLIDLPYRNIIGMQWMVFTSTDAVMMKEHSCSTLSSLY